MTQLTAEPLGAEQAALWHTSEPLEGQHVRLEPLSLSHLPGALRAGHDPVVWQWLSIKANTEAGMRELFDHALAMRDSRRELPFSTILKASGQVIGGTRFMDMQPAHRGLEIGTTWISPAAQRTAANTEAKLLMLSHAFERLGCIRVCLKTHHLNERSQRAIERLGAKRDGVLRNHMIMPDGTIRHSVYYSVTAEEWPATKAGLEAKLARQPV